MKLFKIILAFTLILLTVCIPPTILYGLKGLVISILTIGGVPLYIGLILLVVFLFSGDA